MRITPLLSLGYMWGPIVVTAGAEKLGAAEASVTAARTGSAAVSMSSATVSTTSAAASRSGRCAGVSCGDFGLADAIADTRTNSGTSNTGTSTAAAASSTNGAAQFHLSFAAGASAVFISIVALWA